MYFLKMCLHSDKESNYQIIENKNIKLSKEAEDMFLHALYEVEFDVQLDEVTGEVEIMKVDGRKLEKKEDENKDQ